MFASDSLHAAPYDPPTWRDSTWDFRSEDPGDTTQVSVAKSVGVASTVLIAYGAAYWLVFKKGWWDEQGNDFHFENDFDYALNLDKFGHFASGVIMGESFYEGTVGQACLNSSRTFLQAFLRLQRMWRLT